MKIDSLGEIEFTTEFSLGNSVLQATTFEGVSWKLDIEVHHVGSWSEAANA